MSQLSWRTAVIALVVRIFCALAVQNASAENSLPVWVVTLKNGNVITGTKASENQRVIIIESKGESSVVFRNEIVSIDSTGSGVAISKPTAPLPRPLPRTSPHNSSEALLPGAVRQPAARMESVDTASRGSAPPPASNQLSSATVVSTGADSGLSSAKSPPVNDVAEMGRPRVQVVTFDNASAAAQIPPVSAAGQDVRQTTAASPAGTEALPRPKPRFNLISMAADPVVPATSIASAAGDSVPLHPASSVAGGASVIPPSAQTGIISAPLSVIPAPKFGFVTAKANSGVVPPMQPYPVAVTTAPVKKKRTDGLQELALVDGTVFVGKTISQTERVFVFSSEGASITVLKRLVKSIDGEPFMQVKSVAADSSSRSDYSASTIAAINKQAGKRVSASTAFRSLPSVELPQGSSVASFVDSIRSSLDPKCRSRAARYCGAMGPWAVSAITEVAQLLSDTALSQEPVPLIIDSSNADRLLAPGLEAARALSQLGSQGETELLKAVSNTNQLVRLRAVFGLGTCFLESSEKAVKSALRDPDPAIRRTALGSLRVISAMPSLLVTLGDEDAMVRATAVTLLGKLADRSTVVQLSAMGKDNNLLVRKCVAEALGMSGVPEASPALLILCRDYDPAVRAEAVRALGRVKDGTTIPAILEALKDPMPEVRVGAVESLGLLRDSRAIPALYAALKDENIQVGKKAQISLKQLTDITQLIAALDDESTLVRANAAYVLWLMTGQDNGTDKAKWDSWAAGKSSSSTPK